MERAQVLLIMTKESKSFNPKIEDLEEFNNYCEECKKEEKSVSQNLILTGFKVCESCRKSKTFFPIQLIAFIGRAFILLITKDTERKAIIRKDKKTIPNDLKLDLKFRICLVDIIKPANIQN